MTAVASKSPPSLKGVNDDNDNDEDDDGSDDDDNDGDDSEEDGNGIDNIGIDEKGIIQHMADWILWLQVLSSGWGWEREG